MNKPTIRLHPANETRADWATNALDTFTIETYGGRRFDALPSEDSDLSSGDDFTAVQDLLGDLLHVAARKGWDIDELLRRARNGFDYEAAPGYEGD